MKYIYAIIAIVLIAVSALFVKSCNGKKARNAADKEAALIGIMRHMSDSVTYYKNSNGQLIASNNAIIARYNTVMATKDSLLKAVGKTFGMKPKNISDYIGATLKYHSQIAAPVTRVYDTIRVSDNDSDSNYETELVGFTFPIADSFLYGSGTIDTSLAYVTLDIAGTLDLQFVMGVKRQHPPILKDPWHWLFGKKVYKVEAECKQKSFTFTNLQGLRIDNNIWKK